MAMTEAQRRAKLEATESWWRAALKAAPHLVPREAFDAAHEREAAARAATVPPGPRAAAAAAAPAPDPRLAATPDPAAVEIARLCTEAGRPSLAALYLAQQLTVAEVKHELAVDCWSGALRAAQQRA